ncbi:ABC transporter substrate-binding protein [Tomitella fengzijianii]|uniref:Peptide-binding protein n=1 Tax=Tomitella fengzijianii TaxID=2597660 RepID=A0A516X3B3_9ACTN|nr:ABC transporter substrate-binding protein [Tomitella fengzijianii]QDQ97560.1 peptide-binding protein [Tomitella fengzijianii]
MRARRPVRAFAALAAAGLVGGLVASCSSGGSPAAGIGYVVDGAVPTYNVASAVGDESAARQAFVRVQTGFSYPGPHGETIADTDFGTVTPVAGDPSSIQYRINPAANYSDGAPVVCDDMVLAWAAQSGRFTAAGADGAEVPLFDAPVDPAMARIAAIDCEPGSREAVVHYEGDRAVKGWRSVFGATSMLPSHVVARGAAGIEPGAAAEGQEGGQGSGTSDAPGPPAPAGVDIVQAVQDEDLDAMRSIAHYWNTAFELKPGTADPGVFVSSGPYRLDTVDEDGSIELVANESWWGDKARTERIAIHPRSASVNTLAADGEIEVVDTGAGAKQAMDLGEGYATTVTATDDVEQLIFAERGPLATAAARRAVAACVPRGQIAESFAPGAPTSEATPVQDSRSTLPGTLAYGFVSGTSGGGFIEPDVAAAQAALAEAGLDGLTVRVGYRAPDARRAAAVSQMAKACAPAGIQIHDSGSADFTPQALEDGVVDAVLGGTAGSQSGPPRGPATPLARLAALTTGASGNIGGFSNGRLDEIVGTLQVTGEGADALGLTREAEQILWDEMPTLPLYRTPRQTSFVDGLHAGAPTTSWAGAGWNMDRWMVLN